MLNNLFGKKCPRCAQKNDKQAEYCGHCGISLAFSRPSILNDNRWEAAHNELAVFFMSKNLKGLFSKPLRVPPGMRAWVLQDNEAKDLQEGEYTVEGLFDRLNSFFGGKHTEILITRNAALPINFIFEDILSAELLPVTVETKLFVRVAKGENELAAFRNHFMLRPGAIDESQLHDLLKDSVRQIIAETLGARRLEEMATQGGVREQVNRELIKGLQHRFKDYGLAFDQADTLSLRHDRFDNNRQLKGSMWLEYDEAKQRVEHNKSMAELYSQEELRAQQAREEDMRRRYRNAELSQEEAELAHVIRLRELTLYEKIANADTREHAIDLEAARQVEMLEHQYAQHRSQCQNENLTAQQQQAEKQTQWQHTQEIARIRYQGEIRAAQIERDEAEKFAKQAINNKLAKIQIEAQLEHAKLIEDEAERKAQIESLNAEKIKNLLREQALMDAKHQVAVDEILFAAEKKRSDDAKVQARADQWADKQLEEKIAQVNRDIAAKESAAKLEGLEGLLALREKNMMSAIKMKWEEEKLKLHRLAEESRLQAEAEERSFNRKRLELQDARVSANEDQKNAIERMQVMGSLNVATLIALADNPEKIRSLLELAKVQEFGDMSSEQIDSILTTKSSSTASFAGAQNAQSSGPNPKDEQIELLKSFMAQMSATHASHTDTLVKLAGEAREDIVKVSAMVKDGAVGVAQATSGQASYVNQSSAQHAYPHYSQSQHTAPPNPGTPLMKTCSGCNSVIAYSAAHCPQCQRPLV